MPVSVIFRILAGCLCFAFSGLSAHAKDSQTVLFKAAWLKNEAQSYTLEHKTYRLQQGDTSELET
nr:hypothetical protein [Bacteroidales bacterium]